jgi:hypothetical protein
VIDVGDDGDISQIGGAIGQNGTDPGCGLKRRQALERTHKPPKKDPPAKAGSVIRILAADRRGAKASHLSSMPGSRKEKQVDQRYL